MQEEDTSRSSFTLRTGTLNSDTPPTSAPASASAHSKEKEVHAGKKLPFQRQGSVQTLSPFSASVNDHLHASSSAGSQKRKRDSGGPAPAPAPAPALTASQTTVTTTVPAKDRPLSFGGIHYPRRRLPHPSAALIVPNIPQAPLSPPPQINLPPIRTHTTPRSRPRPNTVGSALVGNSFRRPPPPPPSLGNEARCLQQIVSGFYVAFADDDDAFHGAENHHPQEPLKVDFKFASGSEDEREELQTLEGREFTHVIELYHRHPGKEGSGEGDTSYTTDPKTRAQRLRVALPPTSYAYAPFGSHPYEQKLISSSSSFSSCRFTDIKIEKGADLEERDNYFLELDSWDEVGIPTLTLAQLRAAHAFLRSSGFSIAPAWSTAASSSSSLGRSARRPGSGARVLITTPRDDRTDALCVLATYLATELGRKVSDVIAWIDGRTTSTTSNQMDGGGIGGAGACLGVWQRVVSSQWQWEVGNKLM